MEKRSVATIAMDKLDDLIEFLCSRGLRVGKNRDEWQNPEQFSPFKFAEIYENGDHIGNIVFRGKKGTVDLYETFPEEISKDMRNYLESDPYQLFE